MYQINGIHKYIYGYIIRRNKLGRKTKHNIGDFFGKLEIKEILPSMKSGKHVKLKCECHYCGKETIMNGALIKKMNSCGCQQHNIVSWKSVGPKTMPWQLNYGVAARNNVEGQYKKSAKKRNIEYSLTSEEFDKLITGPCVYCGSSLTNTKKGQGKTSGDFKYTGIDRIDSTQGYTIKNSVSCCWTCNNMKSNFKKDFFLNQIEKIYEYQIQPTATELQP